MGASFVHLHTHTTYSARDGLARLEPLVQAAVADGQPALAVTDHGNLGAAWRFAKLARSAGIKPVIGLEAYLAHGSRYDRRTAPAAADEALDTGEEEDAGGRKQSRYHHLTVLAANRKGWRNLALLDAAAHSPEAFWSKPRMDLGLLAKYSEGLIALTGCLGGPVAGPLAAGDQVRAEANLAQLSDIFGDRLYVEVMDHGLPAERQLTGALVELARRHGLPVVATNDSHYVYEHEDVAHDAWLCVGSQSTLDDPKRWRFPGRGYWLRSAAEMHELFDGQPGTESACQATLEIAERIELNVLPKKVRRLPTVGGDANRALREKIRQGAKRRYGDPLPDVVKQRLEYEFNVIGGAGLADYFLIVEEMISWARANGITVGPGRGSAAGSCVAYCLGIVQVDPIRHGLLFERFLSPDRVGLPDIDTDFEQAGTAKVFEHLVARWGADNVSRIGTFNIALSQASLRLAGKVTGEAALAGKLATAVPTGSNGRPFTFKELEAKDQVTEPFHRAIASSPKAKDLVELARALEGQVNNESVHACGVVVSSEPLPGLVPLRRDKHDPSVRVTEWDGKDIEDMGLVKLDVLGLRNLDIISTTLELIKATTGEELDVYNLPEGTDDPRAAAAWRLIAEGHTAGVFQLESSGMTRLAMRIQPQDLGELSDVIALFRPGPLKAGMHNVYVARKTGREQISYTDFTRDVWEAEQIAAVLDSTYGVPVYQEQLMRLGEVVAGFGPVNRDRLRKAVAKKLHDEMQAVGELFVKGAQSDKDDAGRPRRPFAKETAEKVWASLAGAESYGFNASHSLGYAKLAYITAFLKANWPSQFAAGVLAHTTDEERRIATLRSVQADGIKVKGPDVNLSGAKTTVDADGAVRLGLTEIKGVGAIVAAIVDERQRSGPFSSLADLAARVAAPDDKGRRSKLPVDKLEALIDAGACDGFGPRLGQLKTVHALSAGCNVPSAEWGVVGKALRERLRLGIVLSVSPMADLHADVNGWLARGVLPKPVRAVHNLVANPNAIVSTVGILARFSVIKKGTRRANITIEGSHGTINGVIWSDLLAALEAKGLPQVGDIVGVKGIVRSFVARQAKTDDDDENEAAATEERLEIVVHDLLRAPLRTPVTLSLPAQPVPSVSTTTGSQFVPVGT